MRLALRRTPQFRVLAEEFLYGICLFVACLFGKWLFSFINSEVSEGPSTTSTPFFRALRPYSKQPTARPENRGFSLGKRRLISFPSGSLSCPLMPRGWQKFLYKNLYAERIRFSRAYRSRSSAILTAGAQLFITGFDGRALTSLNGQPSMAARANPSATDPNFKPKQMKQQKADPGAGPANGNSSLRAAIGVYHVSHSIDKA